MPTRPKQSAAGILLAFSLIAGAAIGIARGEPSIGLLAGLAAGIALAALSLLVARRK